MNDDHTELANQEIAIAYGRLGTALAPPRDTAVRVERRVAVRRRRRRTALVGAAGLVLAGTVGGAVLLGSGADADGETVATDQPGPEGSFLVTRTDGSTFTVDDLTLSCDQTPGGEPAEAGRIYLYSEGEPFFYLDAAVDKVAGQTFTLPFESRSGSSDHRAFVVFVADSEVAPGAREANEVSSAEPGAGGTVQVVRAACGPTPVLELAIDATLGSEVEQGSYAVVGSFG